MEKLKVPAAETKKEFSRRPFEDVNLDYMPQKSDEKGHGVVLSLTCPPPFPPPICPLILYSAPMGESRPASEEGGGFINF